jgi:hypothetical protein
MRRYEIATSAFGFLAMTTGEFLSLLFQLAFIVAPSLAASSAPRRTRNVRLRRLLLAALVPLREQIGINIDAQHGDLLLAMTENTGQGQ